MKIKISHGMKNFTQKLLKSLPYLVISILVGFTAVYAGNLTAPSPVANTMYSLEDIYNLATDNTEADIGEGNIPETPSTVESTGVTLTQVYEAVAEALNGAGGIDLSGMYNGSSSTFDIDGGSQANGGVDDANYSGWDTGNYNPPSDRYETEWTDCTLANNYCGTGDEGAQAKDEATGLVWSYPLHGVGGATFDTSDQATLTTGCPDNCAYWNTDTYYSWDGSNENNSTMTAQALCQSKGANWYLPHQKQLMQAYIDGSYGNLEPLGVDRLYWSATTVSNVETYAWSVLLSDGCSNNVNKSNPDGLIRCVQE